MKKKLQVFVSSTYLDLQSERQAAVQTILDAGHIPAGMELFKAGNESQLTTIKKWIDNSDVYMLILGGRYGSIENKSKRSYVELEYKYAIENNIPVFSLVLTESFLYRKASELGGEKVFETVNNDKYDTFKSYVLTKIVKYVDDIKDIQINTPLTLLELESSYNLSGWIRNFDNQNSNDFQISNVSENITMLINERNKVIEDIAKYNNELAMLKGNLSKYQKELADVREEIANLKCEADNINGNLIILLRNMKIEADYFRKDTVLNLFLKYYDILKIGIKANAKIDSEKIFVVYKLFPILNKYNLVTKDKNEFITVTGLGKEIYESISHQL